MIGKIGGGDRKSIHTILGGVLSREDVCVGKEKETAGQGGGGSTHSARTATTEIKTMGNQAGVDQEGGGGLKGKGGEEVATPKEKKSSRVALESKKSRSRLTRESVGMLLKKSTPVAE